MFVDFLHLQQSIKIILFREELDLMLSDHEWYLLERYKKLFEIFRQPTTILQGTLCVLYFPLIIYFLGEKYPTLQTASGLPYIYQCQNALNDFLRHEQSVELKQAIKKGKLYLKGNINILCRGISENMKYRGAAWDFSHSSP